MAGNYNARGDYTGKDLIQKAGKVKAAKPKIDPVRKIAQDRAKGVVKPTVQRVSGAHANAAKGYSTSAPKVTVGGTRSAASTLSKVGKVVGAASKALGVVGAAMTGWEVGKAVNSATGASSKAADFMYQHSPSKTREAKLNLTGRTAAPAQKSSSEHQAPDITKIKSSSPQTAPSSPVAKGTTNRSVQGGKFGVGNSKTISYKGKTLANVSADQLKATGLSLREYTNAWNKSGKRPGA